MGPDTYYDILGVSPGAAPDEIRARYRNLTLRIHPDLDGPAALFRQVQEAYEVLSDPVRRASYDRLLESSGGAAGSQSDLGSGFRVPPPGRGGARSGRAGGRSNSKGSGPHARRRVRNPSLHSVLRRHPAGSLATTGAILLLFGAALAPIGIVLVVLGVAACITAGVAALGGRGGKEREAYLRAGMTAVDAMTGRQFEALLEHFFANKGYRVARIGARGEDGADLLLNDTHGRMIVQARRWSGTVDRDAVLQAMAAMSRYGAARALVVTSSDYSRDAVTMANSNGVTLWNRASLASELTVFRGEPFQPGGRRLPSELWAGSRMCLGFLAALFVVLVSRSAKARRSSPHNR